MIWAKTIARTSKVIWNWYQWRWDILSGELNAPISRYFGAIDEEWNLEALMIKPKKQPSFQIPTKYLSNIARG